MRITPLPSRSRNAIPLDLPPTVVLKLYDRRWINDRTEEDRWNLDREAAAQKRWKAINSGEMADDFDQVFGDDWDEMHEEEYYRRMAKVEHRHEAHDFRNSLNQKSARNASTMNVRHTAV
jgi:hypothetical protein